MSTQSIDLVPEAIFEEVGLMLPEELDMLPFGTICLDNQGKVLAYNAAEEKLAARNARDVIGKNFFFDVAPCTKVRRFHGAFVAGVERKSLNEVFDFTFHFPQGTRDVRIRMLYVNAPRECVWVFATPLRGR